MRLSLLWSSDRGAGLCDTRKPWGILLRHELSAGLASNRVNIPRPCNGIGVLFVVRVPCILPCEMKENKRSKFQSGGLEDGEILRHGRSKLRSKLSSTPQYLKFMDQDSCEFSPIVEISLRPRLRTKVLRWSVRASIIY